MKFLLEEDEAEDEWKRETDPKTVCIPIRSQALWFFLQVPPLYCCHVYPAAVSEGMFTFLRDRTKSQKTLGQGLNAEQLSSLCDRPLIRQKACCEISP